jgi:hypothetical protein
MTRLVSCSRISISHEKTHPWSHALNHPTNPYRISSLPLLLQRAETKTNHNVQQC